MHDCWTRSISNQQRVSQIQTRDAWAGYLSYTLYSLNQTDVILADWDLETMMSLGQPCPINCPVNLDQWCEWNIQLLPHKSTSLSPKEFYGCADGLSKRGRWLVFLGHVKDPAHSEEAPGPAKELERVFRLYSGWYRISKNSALESCSVRGVSLLWQTWPRMLQGPLLPKWSEELSHSSESCITFHSHRALKSENTQYTKEQRFQWIGIMALFAPALLFCTPCRRNICRKEWEIHML